QPALGRHAHLNAVSQQGLQSVLHSRDCLQFPTECVIPKALIVLNPGRRQAFAELGLYRGGDSGQCSTYEHLPRLDAIHGPAGRRDRLSQHLVGQRFAVDKHAIAIENHQPRGPGSWDASQTTYARREEDGDREPRRRRSSSASSPSVNPAPAAMKTISASTNRRSTEPAALGRPFISM